MPVRVRSRFSLDSPAASGAKWEWTAGAADLLTIPVLRYMKTYGLTHEQLAMVSGMARRLGRRAHAQ